MGEFGTGDALWAVAGVAERFESMVDTLSQLPVEPGDYPRDRVTAWPAVVRNFWEAYGREAPPAIRLTPLPEEIDRMDQAIGWLSWLDNDQRRLVLLRGARIRWRLIAEQFKSSRRHVYGRWMVALEIVAGRLNEG